METWKDIPGYEGLYQATANSTSPPTKKEVAGCDLFLFFI